jgi:predicted nuclease with TOPRIM domain
MEEDITILEELLRANIKFTLAPEDRGYQAIENLITEYKNLKEIEQEHQKENGQLRTDMNSLKEEIEELKEKNQRQLKRYTEYHNKQIENFNNVLDDLIPKSKIKEKIEKLNTAKKDVEQNIMICSNEERSYWKKTKRDLIMQIQILEELLKKEN